LHNWQCKSVPPARNHDHFHPFGVGVSQGSHIRRRDLKFRIQQGAINIGG
jgi:hypothetical protein